MARVDQIRQRLQDAFAVEHLEIVDESHVHAGHAGAAAGGGHFRLLIVSADFAGRSQLQRHRSIYQALDDMMPAEIHALSIKALTPEEQPSPAAD